jgi:hypothetical protein
MHSTLPKIIIESNDGKIWQRDLRVLDLYEHSAKGNPFLVHLNNEGPCARELGLYTLLDEICARTNLDKEKITIQTCNLLENHNQYAVKITPPIKHINELQRQVTQQQIFDKRPIDIKKHFGHFIGHSSRFRLAIGSYLYHYHREKTTQTFHSSPKNELHTEFIGLEDLWFNDCSLEEVDRAVEFLKHVPMRFDHAGDGPIYHMKMYGILEAYRDIFLDIVCNTYVRGTTFYMDEKLWRPIITKTPFIVHGSKNFIKNFRKLGFKTFDAWWDEGFSEDYADCQTKSIIATIDRLATLSLGEIQDMYNDMLPTLNHNLEVFMNLKQEKFFKEYEK